MKKEELHHFAMEKNKEDSRGICVITRPTQQQHRHHRMSSNEIVSCHFHFLHRHWHTTYLEFLTARAWGFTHEV